MEPQRVLQSLGGFERNVGNLYELLAASFADDEPAARLFREMAKEEEFHAGLVLYEQAMVEEDPSRFGDIDLDISELVRASEAIASAWASVSTMSVAEAVSFAATIEASAAERHYRLAMQQSNPAFASFIEMLTGEDTAHHARICEFAHRYGLDADGASPPAARLCHPA